MTMRRLWLIGILAAGVISACQNQLPVVTVTAVTTVQGQVLPPTWTPGPPPTERPVTNTPPATIPPAFGPGSPSALPPTWTSVPVVTDTPLPIATLTDDPFMLTLTAYVPPTVPPPPPTIPLDLPTQVGTAQPPPLPDNVTFPAYCTKFQTDTSRTTRTVVLGAPATVAWQQITQADHYQLWVLSPDNVFHYTTVTTGDHLAIPPGQFPLAGLYGWELVAYSSNASICQHLNGVFVVHA